jgi:hypothetical protein
MTSLFQRGRYAVAIATVLLVGCADRNAKPAVAVSGTIAFSDGRPLPDGTRLMFNPADGATESAIAVAGPDGAFEANRVSGRKGVAVGKYTVLLRAPEGNDGSFFKLIPTEYYDGGVLDADVSEGMSPLNLKVKARKR